MQNKFAYKCLQTYTKEKTENKFRPRDYSGIEFNEFAESLNCLPPVQIYRFKPFLTIQL